MPEIKPQDYTKFELNQASNVCRDAGNLLAPAADELDRIVDDLKADCPEDVHFFLRTVKHLHGAAFHLSVAALDLGMIAENIGHTYKRITTLYNRISAAVALIVPMMLLSGLVLPEHIAHTIADQARLPAGFLIGIASANLILSVRTSRIQRHWHRNS